MLRSDEPDLKDEARVVSTSPKGARMPGGNGGRLVGFGQADGVVALPRTPLPVIGDLAGGAGTHRDCAGKEFLQGASRGC